MKAINDATANMQVRHCHVAIVGAGFTGLAVASKATRAEMQVVLIDRRDSQPGESRHAQGFIHHGFTYVERHRRLARELSIGASLWTQMIGDVSLPRAPVYYCYGRRPTMQFTEGLAELGPATCELVIGDGLESLPFEPSLFNREGTIFKTNEYLVRPSDARKLFLFGDGRLARLRGDVVSCNPHDDHCQLNVLCDDGESIDLRCQFVVFAGGKENPGKALRCPKYVVPRSSQTVLIAKPNYISPRYNEVNAVCKGVESVTLFDPFIGIERPIPMSIWIATHVIDGNPTYLITSNILSQLGDNRSDRVKRVLAVVSAFLKVMRLTDGSELQWGAYAGQLTDPSWVKDEDESADAHSIRFGRRIVQHGRIIRAYSERLTLAPAIANGVFEKLSEGIAHSEVHEPWDIDEGHLDGEVPDLAECTELMVWASFLEWAEKNDDGVFGGIASVMKPK